MTELKRKPEVDYYKVLQVDPEAEPEVVEAAYRALSKKYHPDINRAPDAMDRMAQINSAYNIISDASKRRDYNYLRNGSPATAAVAPSQPTRPAPPAPPKPAPTTQAQPTQSSFNPSAYPRPESKTTAGSYQVKSDPYPKEVKSPRNNKAQAARARSQASAGPSYTPVAGGRSRLIYWLIGIFVVVLLAVGVILSLETLFGNPLKTSFIKQVAPTPAAALVRPTAPAQTVTTPQPAIPTNRDQISSFLNNPDFYSGRVNNLDLGDGNVLQLQLRLATNGAVLNSDNSTGTSGRVPDDLDTLRQAESTAYTLIYTLYNRFSDLNRINLVLLDTANKPFYRADVTRLQAFTFYAWHNGANLSDPAEMSRIARQDLLLYHWGAPLADNTRTHLLNPTDANLQAELQNIGMTAVSVTGGNNPVVNYFQVRQPAEMAVDFARILYTLYTRFPAVDKVTITASTTQGSPSKLIDRATFNEIGLESWSQAAYGGPSVGGDRQAQTIIAGLPGDAAGLKPISVSGQTGLKKPVQAGSWAVVAEDVQTYPALSLENQQFPAGKDRQYFVVRVALRNGSDGRQWLLPGYNMSLLDTHDNTVYNSDPAATMIYVLKTPPTDEAPPGPLEAGKQDAVYVAFNVPANINRATLRLQFQAGDKKVLLELS